MAGLLEKTLLMGLGVLTLTREKVKQAVDELVEEEEVEPEEARRLVDTLVAKGKQEREGLRKLVREELDSVRPVTRKEFDQLNQKVDQLLARVEELAEGESEEEKTD